MKKTFYTEWAYGLGIAILALGTALMERADFGMSMVVAPAYIVHLKVAQTFPFFTFGMAEYVLQAVLLMVLAILMRRWKKSYLFSFVTAVIYGVVLDGAIALVALLPGTGMLMRTACYLVGMVLCSAGVALLFRTYISPETYELLVKELAGKWNLPISRVKTAYDCISCAVGVAMSFAFFGFGVFEGVKVGTILCALVNGYLIGRLDALYTRCFDFQDGWKLRKFFAQ